MKLEFSPKTLGEIVAVLNNHEANGAIVKALSKNHNDKNQVYAGSDFRPLHPYFEFEFDERTGSVSQKDGGKHKDAPILEASFKDFRWLGIEGKEVPAKNLKMIIYPQYPEARLSGFDPITGSMPPSMSVEYTKQHPEAVRYLLLARRGTGSALGIMIVNPGQQFIDEVNLLPATPKSRVWKQIDLGLDVINELFTLLADVTRNEHLGCRLDKRGNTIPFNGTQVCGFTLEQTLGIIPNSDKNGDYKGIELKTHTQKKVTLFTPEPDLGPYNDNFNEFMTKYGYRDTNGNYRLTGIHRAKARCEKSGLTLRIENYDASRSLASQTDKEIIIGLYDDDGVLAAGWSLPRILNCWGAKHNEAIYVPAYKRDNFDVSGLAEGYKYLVRFDNHVKWCRSTSADRLFKAIDKGTIFLDPAPKFVPTKLADSKRRSQWRVNDIGKAAYDLYDHVEEVVLEH